MEISSGAHRKSKAHQRAIPYNERHYFSLFSWDRSDLKWLLLVVLVLVLNEMVLVLERRLRDRSGQCPDCQCSQVLCNWRSTLVDATDRVRKNKKPAIAQ